MSLFDLALSWRGAGWRQGVGFLLLAGCVAWGRAQSDALETMPADERTVLGAMAEQAGVIFAGQVIAVVRGDERGYVDVSFRVDQAVRGCSAGTYVLREWAGLWSGQAERYRVGQRFLMLLTGRSASGFSAPVNGMDGAIPILATAVPPLLPGQGVVPADEAAGSDMQADLRWVRARAVRGVGAGVAGKSFAPMSDWVGPVAPMAGNVSTQAAGLAGSKEAHASSEPSLSSVVALLQRFH